MVLNGTQILNGVVVCNNCDVLVFLLVAHDHLLNTLNPPPESQGTLMNFFVFQ